MTQVTKEIINRWGNYSDRKNNFDDDEDIVAFKKLCVESNGLLEFIKEYLPEGNYMWISKPYGKYGVDMGILNKDSGEICLIIDLE